MGYNFIRIHATKLTVKTERARNVGIYSRIIRIHATKLHTFIRIHATILHQMVVKMAMNNLTKLHRTVVKTERVMDNLIGMVLGISSIVYLILRLPIF